MSLPPNFKTRLNERKVIPFVGAGVSMSVKDKNGNKLFPSWKELLEKAVEELKNDSPADANIVDGFLNRQNPDYLRAAKYAREGFAIGWNNFLDRQFNPDRNMVEESSLETAKLIWQLGSSLIITTNYDKVLRWTNNNVNIWDIEAKFRQGKVLSEGFPQEPTVWHLHGYIDNPSNLILTPDGYQKLYPNESNAETEYRTALQTLRTLLTSYTFLFIGFSLNDADFTNQIKYISELFDGATGEHFALVKETDKGFINNLHLPVKPITYEDHGGPLLELLREIIASVESKTDTSSTIETHTDRAELTATERFNPKNRVVHIPFNQKGDQVVGREANLREVHETLLEGLPTNIGQAVSFQGLGGLGKTQLAVEYAYEYQDEYPNGVLWLTVDQDIDKQLVEICDKAEWVSPKSEIKVKLDVARHRLKTIIECLIVLDNVETFDERIKEYLPPPRNDIHILATSRNELIGFNRVWLELLTTEQAVKMLEQESRREIKDAELKTVEQIAEELGKLPLALELAGGFLRYRPIGWESYLSLLKQNPREAFKEKFLAGSFTNHDKDVYRTLKVSENILSDEPLLRDVLDLLTWSGTSPMGIGLMSRLLGKNEVELLEALSLGDSLRLLQKSPERNAYAIHRLVAEVRKEDIPLTESTGWINNICQLLGDWFQDIRDDFTKLPEYEAELEHLVTWQKHAIDFSPENASRLLWLQGYPPFYRGDYNTSIGIVGKALEIYQQTNSENQETLANLYNDYGSLLGGLGKYQEQFDNQKKALDIRLELFGEKHPDTANSFNNVGGAYGDLGKYHEKFDNLKKALDIYLELFGEKHPNTATSFYNLSFHFQNQKKCETAIEYAKKSLAIRREIFGNLHPHTIDSAIQLSSIYTEDKKPDPALRLIDEFLNIVPKLNPKHKDLEKLKRWILKQTQKPGFRQQPVNPFKKKRKKKRR